jgi:hypothetical protein
MSPEHTMTEYSMISRLFRSLIGEDMFDDPDCQEVVIRHMLRKVYRGDKDAENKVRKSEKFYIEYRISIRIYLCIYMYVCMYLHRELLIFNIKYKNIHEYAKIFKHMFIYAYVDICIFIYMHV